jgi:hypothetical protein
MKKLAASIGLVALSATTLHADTLAALDNPSKPWSVSATLRGFYDDNINTANTGKNDSFGFEISPSLGINWAPDPTTRVIFGYVYSMKWYDRKPAGNSDHVDMTHTLNAALEHAFSERYSFRASDSFVIGQEPDQLRAGNAFNSFQRVPGDNIRNYGSFDLTGKLTPTAGFQAGYANGFYDYAADLSNNGSDIPSPSGTLDRIENSVHLDSQWFFPADTTGIIGGQIRFANYTAGEPIGARIGKNDFVETVFSDDRDFREYYLYIGADKIFTPELDVHARVGGRYIEFYNDPQGSGNGFGPYVSLSVNYRYLPDSYVQVGLTEDISSTDLVGPGAGENTVSSFTSSAETTVVYGSVNHQITPKLRGSVMAQFQNSTYSGGNFDNQSEQDYLVGLNLTYQFTPHFSGELGYNYDRLDSGIPDRKFDRNRVYIGVTASY